DGSPVKNGGSRPRVQRDTPTRPRDTHSRLFGQGNTNSPTPMVTDTIRSHIQFGDAEANGSAAHSPAKLANGSANSTPSRGETEPADHSSYTPPKRNPVTGDGIPMPPLRRRHPAAGLRGADANLLPDIHPDLDLDPNLLNPQPTHRYFTRCWPPEPGQYYVESITKPRPMCYQSPRILLGLRTDDPDKIHPLIDPDSLSPQPILDKHWPPFPAQHYLEPKHHHIPYHPLPPHSFVGMTSALGDKPQPDYKYNPIPTLDGPIDPYVIANTNPPISLFKYERDAPIPDFTLLDTPKAPGPFTLTGFPPIFPKHVPGYLFNLNRNVEDSEPKTYYVDYVRQRELEGNPITGDGYKSLNGQINTVTSINGRNNLIHSRVPPGGYSSGLW
ncbi:Microtubule-associated protein Jupiter, partial [Papilio machaon]